MMRAKFSRRLIRQVRVRVPDGAGGYGAAWQERGALWGDVDGRSGGRRVTEPGSETRLKARITIHALPQNHPDRPRPGDRLRDGARRYAVEAVHESDETGRYLVCFASEVTEGAGT